MKSPPVKIIARTFGALRVAGKLLRRPAPAPALAEAERVVLFSLSGMGNAIFAMPLAAEIKQRAPHAVLVVVNGNPAAAEAVRLFGLADEVWTRSDMLQFAPEEWLKPPGSSRALDYAFAALTTSLRPALMATLWGAKCRVGHSGRAERLLTHAVPFHDALHEVRLNLDLLTAVGEPPAADAWPSYPDVQRLPDVPREVADAARPLVALHAGSGGQLAGKRWPVERFAAVADFIQREAGGTVVLVGGMDEVALASRVAERVLPQPLSLVGQTSVAELASVLSNCDALLSSDTGVLHLATAVGTRCVAIYGPTDGGRSPYGPGHVVVRVDMDCSPCYTARTMGQEITCSRDYECLRAVTVQQVIAAVASVIGGQEQGENENEGLHDDRS